MARLRLRVVTMLVFFLLAHLCLEKRFQPTAPLLVLLESELVLVHVVPQARKHPIVYDLPVF